MKKKITILLLTTILTIAVIFVTGSSEKVHADIQADIGGYPSGSPGGGTMGSNAGSYSLGAGVLLKVSLVNIEGSLSVKKSVYFGNPNDAWLTYMSGSQNQNGANQVCGAMVGSSYTDRCESANVITTEGGWFNDISQGMLNIDKSKIESKMTNVDFFTKMLNNYLGVSSILNGDNFDIDNLTNEQIQILENYRIIVEPVYGFFESNNTSKRYYYTVKGMARHMINEGKTNKNLAVNETSFANNITSSQTHGLINSGGLISINTSNLAEYYNTLANPYTGYGYGIFSIVEEITCDTTKECCFDESGSYHEDYSGDTENYKCEDTSITDTCPSEKIINCEEEIPEEIETPSVCPDESKKIPGDLNCSDGEYEQIKNVEPDDITRTIAEGEDNWSGWEEYIKEGPGNRDTDDRGQIDANGNGDINDDKCSSEVTVVISGKASITQKGTAKFSLSPETQYAGGGFAFDIEYASEAKYEVCEKLTFTATRWTAIYTCPGLPTNQSDTNRSDVKYEPVSSINNDDENPKCQWKRYTEETTTDYDYFSEEDWDYYNSACYSNTNCQGCSCSGSGCYCRYETTTWVYDKTIEEDAEQGCHDDSRTYDCLADECLKTKQADGFSVEEEIKLFAEQMTEYLVDPKLEDQENTVKSKDSNDVTSSSVADKNIYEDDTPWNITFDIPSYWWPEETVNYSAIFSLNKETCIDVYPSSSHKAYVEYKDSCDTNEEISGGSKWYIPLKEPDGSEFPVEVNIEELSIIKDPPENSTTSTEMHWPLKYTCHVNVTQKIYDTSSGSVKGFKFIYRPINLNDPFPSETSQYRPYGSNWEGFMGDDTAIQKKLTRDRDGLEYSSILTQTTISKIKSYNNNKTYALDRSISRNGQSSFISRYLSGIRQGAQYNKLGECLVSGESGVSSGKQCW